MENFAFPMFECHSTFHQTEVWATQGALHREMRTIQALMPWMIAFVGLAQLPSSRNRRVLRTWGNLYHFVQVNVIDQLVHHFQVKRLQRFNLRLSRLLLLQFPINQGKIEICGCVVRIQFDYTLKPGRSLSESM